MNTDMILDTISFVAANKEYSIHNRLALIEELLKLATKPKGDK